MNADFADLRWFFLCVIRAAGLFFKTLMNADERWFKLIYADFFLHNSYLNSSNSCEKKEKFVLIRV